MRFLEAINKYGNEWKEIQKYISTSLSFKLDPLTKIFFKLKTFKDSSLGIDFTIDNIKL